METKGKKKEREGKKSDHPELRRIVKGLLTATGEEEQVRLLQQIEKKLLTGYRIRVGSLGIEPLVLEAYYYHETHFADANTHRAPEQKKWDQLYRHCKKADMDRIEGKTERKWDRIGDGPRFGRRDRLCGGRDGALSSFS